MTPLEALDFAIESLAIASSDFFNVAQQLANDNKRAAKSTVLASDVRVNESLGKLRVERAFIAADRPQLDLNLPERMDMLNALKESAKKFEFDNGYPSVSLQNLIEKVKAIK